MNIEITMIRRGWSLNKGTAVLVATFFLGSPASAGVAQTAPQTLPKAEQVLDQFVEAVGGVDSLVKINNRVIKGRMELAGAGITFNMTIYQARPGKAHSIVESDATGRIETGTDGEIAWQVTATAGPQIMEGKEKAAFLHANTFDRMTYWRKAFKQVEIVGIEDVAGKPCYKVVVTPPDLPPQTLFFDKDSHLLAKVIMTLETQAGTFPAEVQASDYRKVDGILMAFKTVTKVMNQERITSIDTVQQNVSLPEDTFALPPDIKALVKK